MISPPPQGSRNGLPETCGYVYRGTGKDTRTPFLDAPLRRVHLDTENSGYPRCGRPAPSGVPVEVTSDRDAVTCRKCQGAM